MAIQFEQDIVDGALLTTAHGIDDSPEDVTSYGKEIVELAVLNGIRKVLCDERDLIYNLGLLDTYETAKSIATIAPKVARVAIVCNPESLPEGEFWRNVAFNRGLQVRIFLDINKAWSWIQLDHTVFEKKETIL